VQIRDILGVPKNLRAVYKTIPDNRKVQKSQQKKLANFISKGAICDGMGKKSIKVIS
jgi:hypothetical protein